MKGNGSCSRRSMYYKQMGYRGTNAFYNRAVGLVQAWFIMMHFVRGEYTYFLAGDQPRSCTQGGNKYPKKPLLPLPPLMLLAEPLFGTVRGGILLISNTSWCWKYNILCCLLQLGALTMGDTRTAVTSISTTPGNATEGSYMKHK
jgi:hypothetical protein